MTKKAFLIVIILVGLIVSGCTENGAQPADNNTTDTPANVTDNVTANASEQDRAESRSVLIPLEKPPFLDNS